MKKEDNSMQEKLLDFALQELEKTMQAVKNGQEPKLSPKLAKMLNAVEEVSDKQEKMSDEEMEKWTEDLSKQLGVK